MWVREVISFRQLWHTVRWHSHFQHTEWPHWNTTSIRLSWQMGQLMTSSSSEICCSCTLLVSCRKVTNCFCWSLLSINSLIKHFCWLVHSCSSSMRVSYCWLESCNSMSWCFWALMVSSMAHSILSIPETDDTPIAVLSTDVQSISNVMQIFPLHRGNVCITLLIDWTSVDYFKSNGC